MMFEKIPVYCQKHLNTQIHYIEELQNFAFLKQVVHIFEVSIYR
jgi:hypothetical protein